MVESKEPIVPEYEVEISAAPTPYSGNLHYAKYWEKGKDMTGKKPSDELSGLVRKIAEDAVKELEKKGMKSPFLVSLVVANQ